MGLGHFRRLRLRGRGMPSQRAACAWLAALAFGLPAAPAQGAITDDDSARTQVALLDTGSVENTASMNFGKIAESVNAGTVVLTPGATATCTVTGGLIHTGACRAARFSLLARRNNRFRIRENSGGTVVLTGPGGATMTVTNITFAGSNITSVNGANGWNLGNYRIDANSGIGEFYLGGTLNINARQIPGIYRGVITIDVQLN
jgi:hypothetical protein